MGIGGISIWQLVIILLIVVLLFGTKKMRNIGADMGSAIKNFRSAMKDGEAGTDKEGDEVPPKLAQTSDKTASVQDKAQADPVSGLSGKETPKAS